MAGDIVAHNMLAPSYPGYLLLQANLRGRAKLRFMTGLAIKMANTVGRGKVPRYQEMLGEFLGWNELADGLIEATARETQRHAEEAFQLQTDSSFNLIDTAKETASLFGSTSRGMVGISMLRFFLPMVNTNTRSQGTKQSVNTARASPSS